jgi:hypothetical protein
MNNIQHIFCFLPSKITSFPFSDVNSPEKEAVRLSNGDGQRRELYEAGH